jgi:hypothetical protein
VKPLSTLLNKYDMIARLMSKSRNTEVDEAASLMIGAYRNSNLNSDAFLASILLNLETQTTKLTVGLKRMKIESELAEKDAARFKKVRAIYYLLLGGLHHPNPEVNSSALTVKKLFDNYGMSMIKENYATKSALIMSMLGALSNPRLKGPIASVAGLAETIEALRVAQNDFEQYRVSRDREKAKEGVLENATAINREVVNIINGKLVVYLKAMQQVDEALYGSLSNTIAQIIADNNKTVKKRAKKPAHETNQQ